VKKVNKPVSKKRRGGVREIDLSNLDNQKAFAGFDTTTSLLAITRNNKNGKMDDKKTAIESTDDGETKSSSTADTVVNPVAASIETSIPYDAAVKLAYEASD